MIDFNTYIIHIKKSGKKCKHFKCTCDICGVDRGYQSKSKAYKLCLECVRKQPEYRKRLSETIKATRSTEESKAKTKRQMDIKHKSIRIKNKYIKIIKMLFPDWWKTDQWRDNIAKAQTGKPAHNKGKPISLEQKIKQSCSYRSIKIEEFDGFITHSLQYRLRHNLRSRLSIAIKRDYKSGSAVKDLGCTIEELKVYLESKFQEGMSWENYGIDGWEIDHIKALANFNLVDTEQLKVACHYTNLQPLWVEDNRRKGAR